MENLIKLTDREKDVLLDLILKEVNSVNNLNSTMRGYLIPYREEVLGIYQKICDSLPND